MNMIRKIFCPPCNAKFTMHPIDVRDGWKIRRVPIIAKTSHDLHIILIEDGKKEIIPTGKMRCDRCDRHIKGGETAIAVTMWVGSLVPKAWEKEYVK